MTSTQMEGASRARFRVPLIAAAILFAPAVGAGVWVGRSIPERRPKATEQNAEARSAPWVKKERQELASCQETLAALETLAAFPEAGATLSADAVSEDAGRTPATVEELEAELRRCTKNELLVSAEVCSAAGRQFDALMALPKDGLRCGPKSRAADLIEEDFERCAAFADMPANVRTDDLTKEQASLIAEAIKVHQTLTEEELLRRLKDFVYTCTETPPKLPPGVKKAPMREEVDR
ncbi:MAG: hypothetical protein IPM54_20150 [Polyangiaceae bacterium]|nr:hypothetical protein [Polyangiaceae bacterium]